MPDELQLAWAAGFLDGDGSFGTVLVRSTGRVRPHISAAQAGTDAPLRVLLELFGGNLATLKKPTSSGNTVYQWHVRSSEKIAVAIEQLLPHLVVKHEAASALLATIRSWQADPNRRQRLRRLTPEAVAEIRSSTESSRVLAERFGVHRSTIWEHRHRVERERPAPLTLPPPLEESQRDGPPSRCVTT